MTTDALTLEKQELFPPPPVSGSPWRALEDRRLKRFKSLAVIAALLGATVLLSACDKIPGLNPKFGNFGGGQQKLPKGVEPFDPKATKFGIRWFPTHVHFGPDGDTLLVSLCHVSRSEFCRIGKYSVSRNHWDILPFEENRTYVTPVFSPDGQWIVYSGAPCKTGALCDARDFQLFRTTPDGAKTELLADTVALYPSFAHNGKKLIYWRWNIIKQPGEPKFAGAIELYQLEWETKKETALTNLIIMPGDQWGRPFFLPDGEKFVFTMNPYVVRNLDYEAASKAKTAPTENVFIGSMANAPIDRNNYKTLEAYTGYEMLDMDREGRILYWGDLGEKKKGGNPVALALRLRDPNYKGTGYEPGLIGEEKDRRYPYAKLTDEQLRRGEGTAIYLTETLESNGVRAGEDRALFLRKPGLSHQDEAGFDIVSSCSGSVSPNGKRLAFIWVNCALVNSQHGLGLINRDQPMKDIQFIDWPRLDLIPTNSAATVRP